MRLDPLPFAPPQTRRLAAAAFVPLLALWTWKLLVPNPVPEGLIELLSLVQHLVFFCAKTLHASGYATLTILGLVAAPSVRWRWWLMTFLILHGVLSELGQTYVPNRTGKVTDVCIDWIGMSGGVLAWRRLAPWLATPSYDTPSPALSPDA